MQTTQRSLLTMLFGLTGATALLIEQAFEKLLSTLLGSSTPAAAMVLAMYFGGLALGAWLYGRARRVSPSRMFAALVGWPAHPNFRGIDVLGPARPDLAERVLFAHTDTPLSHTDAVWLAGRWKYMLDYRSGRGAMFDRDNDPGEQHDLSGAKPAPCESLRALLQRWRQRQLAYYQFAPYYETYYPPRPPAP